MKISCTQDSLRDMYWVIQVMQLKHDEIWLKHDFSFDCVCYSFLSIPWGFIQADETWSVFDIKDWVSLISMVCYYSRVVFSYWKSQINPNVRCFILLIDLWVFYLMNRWREQNCPYARTQLETWNSARR